MVISGYSARTLVLLAVLAALAGCTSRPGPEPAQPTLGAYEQTDLEALLYEIGTVWEGQEAEDFVLVEEAIAACMRAEGFEYQPQAAPPAQMNPADLGALPGTREFAEQYGYGITTDPWQAQLDDVSGATDPNAEMLGAMTEAEITEYYAALYGTDASEEYDWRSGGCAGRADHEVNGTVPGLDDDALAILMGELTEVLSVTSDASLEPLVGRWAECMSEAGYPGLTSVDQPAAEIAGRQKSGGDPDELAKDEIEMATADLECRESVGYTQALREIQVERQEDFSAANRAELEAWRDGLRELAGE